MRATACALALALLGACGGNDEPKPKAEPEQREDHESDDDQPAEPPPSFGGMGQFGALSKLLQSATSEPGPYDEPRESPGFDAKADHVVVLELTGAIDDLEGFSWFGGGGTLELRAVTERFAELAREKHVTGMVVRVGDLAMDQATATELRAALLAFKTAGGKQRSLWCHTEGAADTGYYVMTACDDIGIAPLGAVSITGPAAMPLHVKGLLDKLGLRADFVHVGAYKGAAEPLTRTEPSREMRETLAAILDGAYATLVAGIADGRKLDPAAVRALIDEGLFQDEQAVTAKLADRVAVFERYRDAVIGASPWRVVKLSGDDEPDMAKLMEFLGMSPRRRPRGDHIALVYATGNVIDGKGEGILGARTEIASRTLAAALRALAADDKVKAVVLRIDSGGGSALASEIIWHAVVELKAKKPVIVSMGGIAASGGYYIGCGATKIYALPDTLTGSIGVVGGKIVLGGAMKKLGVTTFPMAPGKRGTLWASTEPWKPDERKAVLSMMEGVYQRFVERVAEGRGMRWDDVHAIAQGRVWTGAQAVERGLVDELGTLEDAIAAARELAGVKPDKPIEIYPPEPTLVDIVGSFGEVTARPFGLDTALAALLTDLGPEPAAVLTAYLDQLLLLRDSPILAATLFPVVLR